MTRCPRCGQAEHSGGSCPERVGVTESLPQSAPIGELFQDAATDLQSHPLDPARRYRVIEKIGRGGMGIVYKVHDLELDEVIALKVLDPMGESASARERFKREIKIARRINHPNVARVFDLIAWNNRLAISQEYIEGSTLERLAGEGPVPSADIQRVLRYLCSALDAAHALGIVHRDLKPANVLVDGHGQPRIVDFGTAVLTGNSALEQSKTVFATPSYMAPELVLDPERADPRTDIYSLGVILFQLATGRLPFVAKTLAEMIEAHVESEPPRPRSLHAEVSPAIEEVILRCLAKNPGLRYPSAGELFRELEERLGQERRDSVPVALPQSGRGKVLVIDDDDDLRAWMRAILRATGCAVIEAADGLGGIQAALAEKPDLVLLDILMPRLDGRDTLRILKGNPATQGIPVVMVTSLTDEEEALFSKESGAAAFLNKPVQPDVLGILVERYVSSHVPCK